MVGFTNRVRQALPVVVFESATSQTCQQVLRQRPIKQQRIAYLPTIDGWRGVAILLVLCCHLSLPWSWFRAVHGYGRFGVDLFFGISGLLITYRLISEHEASGRISLRHFYARRGWRILPAAFAYLTIVLLLNVAGVLHVRGVEVLAGAFFFTNYINPSVPYFWYVGHFWSLSVEEHFYLLWPGLLKLSKPKFGMALSSGLALAFAGWRMLDSHFHWISAHWLIGNGGRSDYRADALLWGCAAAFALRSAAIKKMLCRWLPMFWPAIALVSIAGLAAYPSKASMPLIALIVPTLMAYTLLHPDRLLGKTLEHRVLRWIGRLSYSLYLWQQLFLTNREWLPKPSVLQSFPVNVVLAFGCAYLSYRFIERPCIALGNRKTTSGVAVKPTRQVSTELAAAAFRQRPSVEIEIGAAGPAEAASRLPSRVPVPVRSAST